MRCNPTLPQQQALPHFDSMVRGCSSATSLGSALSRSNGAQRPEAFHTSPATWPTATAALGAYKASVATAFTLDSALTQSQRALAAQVDLCGWKQELEAASLTRKAVLLSEAEPGGRTFLAAVPAGPKRMEPAVILAELRHRL